MRFRLNIKAYKQETTEHISKHKEYKKMFKTKKATLRDYYNMNSRIVKISRTSGLDRKFSIAYWRFGSVLSLATANVVKCVRAFFLGFWQLCC